MVQVGDFEASFVPTVKDFNRLDARFQLPAELFAKMPDYQHFGFAVFKLKPGMQTVQPMAFDFPAAKPGHLFFPTVHIHDWPLFLVVVAFSSFLHDMVGQVFAMFVLTVAAAEAAIGLAILVVYFRNRGTIAVEDIHLMKG